MNYIENVNLLINDDDEEVIDFFLKNVYNINNFENSVMFVKSNINILPLSTLGRICSLINHVYLNDERYPFTEILKAFKIIIEKFYNITISEKNIEAYIVSLKHKPKKILNLYKFTFDKNNTGEYKIIHTP